MADDWLIHDISMTLDEPMLTYPGDVPYQRTLQRDRTKGDSSNVSVINTSVHVGSHVDAPRHYLTDSYGADKIPLHALYGPAYVLDCIGLESVTAAWLDQYLPESVERLLLKTDNSQWLHCQPPMPFRRDFVYLDGAAARLLAQRSVKLVGIDYLSIDKSGLAAKPAHYALLENNIVILEGIDLTGISPGRYFLACGPLKMAHSDGAPCRVVLIENLL